MERPVRDSAMVGVVLILLAAVIGLAFGLFSLSKGTANEGVVESQGAVNNFMNINYSQFEDKIVTGRDVLSVFKTFKNLSNNFTVNSSNNIFIHIYYPIKVEKKQVFLVILS